MAPQGFKMHHLLRFKLFLAGILLVANAMMDYRHFAQYDVPTVDWVDPGVAPPSFILALDQNRPPYDLSVEASDSFPGCRAQYATVCSIQNAIRLVTRARLEACPAIEAGGDEKAAALANITAGAIYANYTSGFGVFVLDTDGTILADALKPGFVGQRINGLAASGFIAQVHLMNYIKWAASNGGGFVPHYTTRISESTISVASGGAPLRATAYFEMCETGEYVGVAFGREALPAVENCDAALNGFCTVQNIRRIIGLAVTDILNMHSFHQMIDHHYATSYSDEYEVGDIYLYNALISWWGYPGSHPYRNENSFPDNNGTMWAIGNDFAKYGNGWNGSDWMAGTVTGDGGTIANGNYIFMVANSAAWAGGAWQDWESGVRLGLHQISFTVGYLWNGTAFGIGALMNHLPADALLGPGCQTCRFDRSWPCAMSNVYRLSGHIFSDFVTPEGSWSRISRNLWFGSAWENATGSDYEGTWPEGLFSYAFDWDGVCVSSTRSPDDIGLTIADLHEDTELHDRCTVAASSGGAWLEHTDIDGVPRLSYVTMLSKSGSVYYMLVGFSKVMILDESGECSSDYSEPCSEVRAQDLVGGAAAEILAAQDESDIQTRVLDIMNGTTDFSSEIVGDFQVYVYTAEAECLDYVAACSDLPSTWKTELIDTAAGDDGWVLLESASTTEESQQAYVRPVEWYSPTSTDTLDLLVVVFLGTETGPPMCSSTSDCPSSSTCTSGRCFCDTGYTANYTEESDLCADAKFLPTTLACVDVRNMDCDGLVCSTCPGGYYCPYGTALPCSLGYYCPEGGEMSGCPAGTIGVDALATSESSCEQCAAGTYGKSEGKTVCEACTAGTYAGQAGQSRCEACDVGTYQETTQGTSCVACPTGFTTTLRGATSSSECVCPRGTYQPINSQTCVSCPEGMSCTTANSTAAAIPVAGSNRRLDGDDGIEDSYPYPTVLPGYMTLVGHELSPYKCKEAAWCPGGGVGSCASNRDSNVVSCAKCDDNTHSTSDGSCEPCSAWAAPVIMISGCFVGLMCLAIFAHLINRSQLNQSNSTTVIVISLGLVVSSIQTLAMFSNLDVQWMSPVKEMFDVLKLMTFDLKLLQLECFVGNNSVWNLLVQQLVVPFAGLYICVIVYLKKVLKDPGLEVLNESINAIGGLFQLFFVSIMISCLTPFICYKHPADLGHSMVSDPAVLCTFEGDHLSMSLVCIIVSLFIILPYVALGTFATAKYRKLMGDAVRSYQHLRRFKFLFYRYTPPRYWFGICVIFRGVLVCLAPVVFRDYAALQVLAVSTVLLLFCGVQLYTHAWRGAIANFLDASIVILLVLLLMCVAMTTDFDDTSSLVGTFAAGVLVSVFVAALVIIGVALARRMLPNPFYHFFICHHKAAAAAQARYLQLLFMQRTGRQCFLDSDHLTNLEELFDIVRIRCGRLIVYLTAETLRRPWCAGEITIAWKIHKRVLAVRHPSLIVPSWQDLEVSKVPDYLSSSDFKLVEYGITDHLISSAFRWLLYELQDVVCVPLSHSVVGRVKFDVIVEQCLLLHSNQKVGRTTLMEIDEIGIPISSKSTSSKSNTPRRFTEHTRPDRVVISSLPDDDESVAAAGILIGKIQSSVVELVPEGMLVLTDIGEDFLDEATTDVALARMLIVILSEGSLQSIKQLQAVVTAMGAEVACVPVSLPSFRFPMPQYFEEELPDRFGATVRQVESRLQLFFKTISIAFTTYASEQVLNVQAQALVARIPKHAVRAGSKDVHPKDGEEIDLAELEALQQERASARKVSSRSSRRSRRSLMWEVPATCAAEFEEEEVVARASV